MTVGQPRVLAVIPARGGSIGLPGKNIRSLAGLPLIVHSIRLAALCPEITRSIVSTDSPEIAGVAQQAERRFPSCVRRIWRGTTPPCGPSSGTPWRCSNVAATHPTTSSFSSIHEPGAAAGGRLPGAGAARQRFPGRWHHRCLTAEFNPIWHCVVEEGGWMKPLLPSGGAYTRRQDVPPV